MKKLIIGIVAAVTLIVIGAVGKPFVEKYWNAVNAIVDMADNQQTAQQPLVQAQPKQEQKNVAVQPKQQPQPAQAKPAVKYESEVERLEALLAEAKAKEEAVARKEAEAKAIAEALAKAEAEKRAAADKEKKVQEAITSSEEMAIKGAKNNPKSQKEKSLKISVMVWDAKLLRMKDAFKSSSMESIAENIKNNYLTHTSIVITLDYTGYNDERERAVEKWRVNKKMEEFGFLHSDERRRRIADRELRQSIIYVK